MINVDSESEINPYNDNDILEVIFTLRVTFVHIVNIRLTESKSKVTETFGLNSIDRKKNYREVFFLLNILI